MPVTRFHAPGQARAQDKPGAPSVTSVTSGSEHVIVHWTAPANTGASPVTGYKVR
ncbi:MAG: fibronectin type III domain-containing protein [Gammaproteobacteria bacterium]